MKIDQLLDLANELQPYYLDILKREDCSKEEQYFLIGYISNIRDFSQKLDIPQSGYLALITRFLDKYEGDMYKESMRQ